MAVDPRTRAVELATEKPDRLLCVIGPTASGKTALAVDVAEHVGGEIISADSVQIYRGFDIGSGKPSEDEKRRAPHHFVDSHDPLEAIDASSYAKLADRAIADVRARGRIPILCGGTFFWVRALVLGLAEAPAADQEIRRRHREIVEAKGRTALHEELKLRDPASAYRLHPNDVVRVSRALEVLELSGRPMSEFQAEHGFRERRMDAAFIGLRHEPELLAQRIAARVDAWLATGWIDEVRDLVARGYGEARAAGSVGYAQIRAHLAGEVAEKDLRDAIVRATKIFARRQRTWLNHTDVEWL